MPSETLNAAIAVTRFGLGGRPGEIAAASPDPIGFLTAQIRRDGADLPAGVDSIRDRVLTYRTFVAGRRQLTAAVAAGTITADARSAAVRRGRGGLEQSANADILARAQLAATTDAGFRERWALFWANHFTVSGHIGTVLPLVGPFEREAIRPRIFGRFRDMADAVLHHPAMLTYLDQVRSIGPNSARGLRKQIGLNENLARETLELHTLGAESGYTQADVTEFARALTGFTIGTPHDGGADGGFHFDPALHEPGARTVMGRRYDQSGEHQAAAILRAAADDPRTARHIAGKLARHFVSDQPPPELAAAIERAWIGSDGDLATVAHVLIADPAAWAPAAAKFKTPGEFLISCYRACGRAPDTAAAVRPVLQQLGQPASAPPSPKGWPDEAAAWATSDAVLDRLGVAEGLAAGVAGEADPLATARVALGARLTAPVQLAMQRAESRAEALTLLFMSPEFQRR